MLLFLQKLYSYFPVWYQADLSGHVKSYKNKQARSACMSLSKCCTLQLVISLHRCWSMPAVSNITILLQVKKNISLPITAIHCEKFHQYFITILTVGRC